MPECVIIVDESDREVGREEKLLAHRVPRLHRAFSVFVLDPNGRMLLQRRAAGKYHSSDLWSNACCGHPRPGEMSVEAAQRRLQEEMGFSCELTHAGTVQYRLSVGADLEEHEYDHVFVGLFQGEPAPDPDEVGDWCWIDRASLRQALERRPAEFTAWFRLVLDRLETSIMDGSVAVAAW